MDTHGEGGATALLLPFAVAAANSGVDLYGDAADAGGALHRLRLYYSGGMTPDGLIPLQPDLFADYFELRFASGAAIGETGVPTRVGPATDVTVLGLADLGPNQEEGYVEVRAFGKGKRLYNPSGPDPTPFEGVRYTAPAPANQVVAVNVDLANDRRTTFCLKQDDIDGAVWSRSIDECEEWRSAGLLRAVSITGGNDDRVCPGNLLELANAEIGESVVPREGNQTDAGLGIADDVDDAGAPTPAPVGTETAGPAAASSVSALTGALNIAAACFGAWMLQFIMV